MEPGGGAGPDNGEAGGQQPDGGGAVVVGTEGGETVQRRGVVGELAGAVGKAEGAVVVRGEGGGEGLGGGGQRSEEHTSELQSR